MRSLCSGETRANTDVRVDRVGEAGVVEAVQLGAGQRPPRSGDAEVGGDGLGGERVVAGDHHRADARAGARRDRVADLGSGRVDDADQAEQGQVLLGDRSPVAVAVGAKVR